MDLNEWKEFVREEAGLDEASFPKGKSLDYRSKDSATLSAAIDALARQLKQVQFQARALNHIGQDKGIEAHYSWSATNAARAINMAVKLLAQAVTIMSEAEESWLKDQGKSESALSDRAMKIILKVEPVLRGVVAKGFR